MLLARRSFDSTMHVRMYPSNTSLSAEHKIQMGLEVMNLLYSAQIAQGVKCFAAS